MPIAGGSILVSGIVPLAGFGPDGADEDSPIPMA
jgi:hypothetical protein